MDKTTLDNLKKAVSENLAQAKALSDDLHAHPEIAETEYESSKKIVAILKEHGFEVEYPFFEKELGYGTAFKAVLDCGEGPSVAILTEYDALPVVGHACGHNLHGAMSVLAGVSLSKIKDSFKGKLYVIGTPAEEVVGAKIKMSSEGVFDEMALAVMIHSFSGIGSQPQMDLLNLRCFELEFFGKQAHAAAAPWQGHSALAAARKFMDLVDARRECFTPDVRVNSVVLSGGEAPNIIPAYTKLRTEFRTGSMGTLKTLDDTVRKCAAAAAMALDCEVKIDAEILDFYDMVRVGAIEDAVAELFTEVGEPVLPVSPPVGSSDMGNVSYRCPSVQPLMSIVDENYPLHSPEFAEATLKDKALSTLERGAYVIGALALKMFNDSDFCEKVAEEFKKSLKAKNG